MLGGRNPVQIEKHLTLLETTRQEVLWYSGRNVVACPSSCVGNKLSFRRVDRYTHPLPQEPVGAVAETKGLDKLRCQPTLGKVRVFRIKREDRGL